MHNCQSNGLHPKIKAMNHNLIRRIYLYNNSKTNLFSTLMEAGMGINSSNKQQFRKWGI